MINKDGSITLDKDFTNPYETVKVDSEEATGVSEKDKK